MVSEAFVVRTIGLQARIEAEPDPPTHRKAQDQILILDLDARRVRQRRFADDFGPRDAPVGGERRIERRDAARIALSRGRWRSEEHTSELQSLMRISYAVFCLKKKKVESRRQNLRRK